MIDAPQCVICDGRIRRLQRALVAPFLARRIWDRPPFCVDLVRCSACGFTFYNPRLDAAEEGRLYANYRSEEYRRMRQSSEPWYTAKFNAGLAAADYFERRRRVLGGMLRQHIGNRVIRRVLDYGGDHGDLVCGLVDGAAAFVYDISGVPAAAGVTATTDPVGSQADLIVNSHVLEHVGFPRRLLEDILKASPAGGLVFLEVPCELPFGLSRIARRIAQIGVVALMRPAVGSIGGSSRQPVHDARARQLFHGAIAGRADAFPRMRRDCGRQLRARKQFGESRHGVVPGDGSVAGSSQADAKDASRQWGRRFRPPTGYTPLPAGHGSERSRSRGHQRAARLLLLGFAFDPHAVEAAVDEERRNHEEDGR